MAKIRIRNASKGPVGLSFVFLFKNQHCTVDEAKLQPRDRRLIEATSGLLLEDPATPIPQEVAPSVPENPPAPVENDPAETPELAQQSGAAPVGPGEAPQDPAAPSEPSARHGRDVLDGLSRKDLKILAEALGVKGRTRAELIDGIIRAEEKR